MSSLYHKMTLEQRKNAEPFPHVEGFPSAPQAPDAPPRVAAPPVPPVPPVPPTPPAPTSVIGLIEDMQNKNAVFIYNSKEISAEEALDIAKSKKINSVSSCVDKDGKYEVVLFSE
jgi:bla regulator protein BlaR1